MLKTKFAGCYAQETSINTFLSHVGPSLTNYSKKLISEYSHLHQISSVLYISMWSFVGYLCTLYSHMCVCKLKYVNFVLTLLMHSEVGAIEYFII